MLFNYNVDDFRSFWIVSLIFDRLGDICAISNLTSHVATTSVPLTVTVKPGQAFPSLTN